MAFGKKKDQDEATAALAGMPPPEAEQADELAGAFATSADGASPEPATEAAAPTTAPEPPADALGSPDALLNMFQESQVEDDDRSVLLELAGDAQIADLLEDLHTLAAAMGITAARAA